ncbi:hypothetical protein MMC10_007136 [Thelotrema lepadinum]|nr:hypothetical protein [Thelotrema lepadinum]
MLLSFDIIFFLTFTATLTSPVAKDQSYFRQLFEFGKPQTCDRKHPGPWLGSIVARPCGSLLVTDLINPSLYQFDPFANPVEPQLVTNFSGASGLAGITETKPDVYEVVAAKWNPLTQTAFPNTTALWRVDFSSSTVPTVSLTANLSQIPMLNGLTYLHEPTVLGSDSTTGAIWSIDTQTGYANVLITDPLMLPTPLNNRSSQLGVNGIKLHSEASGSLYLYFTNTALSIFAKIQIDPQTGEALSKAVEIAAALDSQQGVDYDDFALSEHEGCCCSATAYLCNSRGNAVSKLRLDDVADQHFIAGSNDSTLVEEPSSATFGRTDGDRHVLYVSTAGGWGNPINGTICNGGQILAIDTTET